MLRFAIVLIVIATLVGTMMPASAPSVEGREEDAHAASIEIPAEDDGHRGSVSGGEVTLRRASDGHFYADVRVNGTTINFMVDTGATTVALSEDDARRAGVDFDSGNFAVVGRGASGLVEGEPVTLREMEMGPHRLRDIGGVVLDGAEISLLGQSFLSRIGTVTIEDDRMVLR